MTRAKQPPYASQWQRWADTLYAYQLLLTKGQLKLPHSKLVGNIYILADDRQAWAACKDGYRDFNPRSAGGADWGFEPWTDEHNTLDFRFYNETCRVLIPAKEDPAAFDFEKLARPFLWVRIWYDAARERQAAALAKRIDPLFIFVYGVKQ